MVAIKNSRWEKVRKVYVTMMYWHCTASKVGTPGKLKRCQMLEKVKFSNINRVSECSTSSSLLQGVSEGLKNLNLTNKRGIDHEVWSICCFNRVLSRATLHQPSVQYRLKLLTHLPRFCRGRFADQHLVLASAMTRHAKILLRFYLGLLRHKIPR